MFKKRFVLFLIPFLLIGSLAYGFTRDWSTTSPIDHSLNSLWPASIRNHRVDVSERLDSWIYGFTSGETNEGLKRAPYIVQGSDPGATGNTAWIYAKDVSSTAELFAQDEAGNVIALTAGGKLAKASVCEVAYPVGSIYIATVATNPATLLGCGTWSVFGAGKMMVSLNSADTDFDTAEETGGAKTYDVSHTHSVSGNTGGVSFGGGGSLTAGALDTAHTHSISITSGSGGSSTQNVMNPYIVVYTWERDS